MDFSPPRPHSAPAIESEPGQLPVQIETGIVQIDVADRSNLIAGLAVCVDGHLIGLGTWQ